MTVFSGRCYLTVSEFKSVLRATVPELKRAREIRLHQPKPAGSNAGRPRKLTHGEALFGTFNFLLNGEDLQKQGDQMGLAKPTETIYHCLQAFVLANHHELRFPSQAEQLEMLAETPFPEFPWIVGPLDGSTFPTTRRAGDYSKHHEMWGRNGQFIMDNYDKIIYFRGTDDGARADSHQINAGEVLKNKLAPGMKVAVDNGYCGVYGTQAVDKKWPPKLQSIFRAHRARIEHLFSRLKCRFKILRAPWHAPASLHMHALAVYSCAILYNIAHRNGRFLLPQPKSVP